MDERATRALQFILRYGRPASEVFGKLADGRPVPEQADYSHMERVVAALATGPEFNKLIGLESGSFWSIRTGPDSRVTVEVSRVFNTKIHYLGALSHKPYSCTRVQWFQTKEATLVTRKGQPVDEEHHRRSKVIDNLKEPSGVLGMPSPDEVDEVFKVTKGMEPSAPEPVKREYLDLRPFLNTLLLIRTECDEYGVEDPWDLLTAVLADSKETSEYRSIYTKVHPDILRRVEKVVRQVASYEAAESVRRLLKNAPTSPDLPEKLRELKRLLNNDELAFALALVNA